MKRTDATQPTRLSDYFKLGKSQHQLDFVDVFSECDIPLFIDPSLFSLYDDIWSNACHNDVCGYFQSLVDRIIKGQKQNALQLLRWIGFGWLVRAFIARRKKKPPRLGGGRGNPFPDRTSALSL